MNANKFIKIWLIILIIFMSSVALLNLLIDPYGLWNTPRIESFNKLKPAASTRNRLVKPHQLRNFQEKTLIMGNSRPEMGLDPSSACWPEDYKPIYNQAIPGVTLYDQFRLLQHAVFFHKPEKVILGIDFVDFLNTQPMSSVVWPPVRDMKNLSVDIDGKENTEYKSSVIHDKLKTTFSLNALSDSIYTLLAQSDHYSSNRTEAGFNTANDYKKIIAAEGQNVLFQQKNNEMVQRLNRPMYLFNKDHWSKTFEVYKQLLDFTKEKKINIIVFINPYHSDYLEVIRQTGHWKQFIEWKTKIAQITLSYDNISLWDFAVLNSYTKESLPMEKNSKKHLKWFWEPAHYNKNYGSLMLSQMLDINCVKAPKERNIGIFVNDISQYKKELSNKNSIKNSVYSIQKIKRLVK